MLKADTSFRIKISFISEHSKNLLGLGRYSDMVHNTGAHDSTRSCNNRNVVELSSWLNYCQEVYLSVQLLPLV